MLERRARGFAAAAVVAALVAPPQQPVSTTPAALSTPERNPKTQVNAVRVQAQELSTARTKPVDKPKPQKVKWYGFSAIIRILVDAASKYGIDVDRFISTAECESGLRPDAVSSSGLYRGLFQHHAGYWSARASRAGFKGASVFDARANAFVSAWMIRFGGGWSHWPNCSR